MNKCSDLTIFYINSERPAFNDKRIRMEEKLTEIGLSYERVPVPEQNGRATVNIVSGGHRQAAQLAIDTNKFPLLILEDDAELLDDFPFDLELNKDAKLIYFGLSLHNAGQGRLELTDYDDDYYRVKNSLAAHAILIPTRESAEYYIDLCDRSIDITNWHDKELAYDSQKELFLTPKKGPVFFQTDGHTRPVTNFELDEFIID
jgi:hypothetical protein|tara:strand:- start:45 stop:653 length:609 start_codon:yes stop_codon:yes gene_type:complete